MKRLQLALLSGLLLLALLLTMGTVWSKGKDAPPPPDPTESIEGIQVPPPPFSEGIFPCSQCHADLPTNPKPRKLEEHTNIELKGHDEQHRWCLGCHTANNRDKLHLAGGELIDFTESYKLCGQCHGPQYRDWKLGVHGKRIGDWDGKKTYFLCAHCHNPHSPHFKPIKPLPPPVKPEDIK